MIQSLMKIILNLLILSIMLIGNSVDTDKIKQDNTCIASYDYFLCRDLAHHYLKNNKKEEAIESFKYACINLNDPYSCSELGDITVTKSLAISYYKKSCLLKGRCGCRSLGYIYLDGWGKIKKNISEGIKFLEKSCKFKEENSCIELAKIYHDGEIVKFNKNKEIFFLKKACNRRDNNSCRVLGKIYRKSNKNIGNLLEYYRKLDNKKETWVGYPWLDDFDLKYVNINNSTYKSLYSFCKATGLKESEIRKLNPWINKDATNISADAEIVVPYR